MLDNLLLQRSENFRYLEGLNLLWRVQLLFGICSLFMYLKIFYIFISLIRDSFIQEQLYDLLEETKERVGRIVLKRKDPSVVRRVKNLVLSYDELETIQLLTLRLKGKEETEEWMNECPSMIQLVILSLIFLDVWLLFYLLLSYVFFREDGYLGERNERPYWGQHSQNSEHCQYGCNRCTSVYQEPQCEIILA